MGYTTRFKGVLKFKTEPTVKELAHLKKVMATDFPDGYCDLVITDDFTGLEWDTHTEKTYYLATHAYFFALLAPHTGHSLTVEKRGEDLMLICVDCDADLIEADTPATLAAEPEIES